MTDFLIRKARPSEGGVIAGFNQAMALETEGIQLDDSVIKAGVRALFENPEQGNHWLTLRLVGESSNRAAIGARIALVVEGAEGRREIHRTVSSGGSFGASSLQQEIGLGGAERISELRVRWPLGAEQVWQDVPMDGECHGSDAHAAPAHCWR